MNCEKAKRNLSAYLDSELDGSQMIAIQYHLRECETCQREFDSYRQLKSDLGRLKAVAPDTDLLLRLKATIAEQPEPVVAAPQKQFAWGRWAMAAAACAGLAMAVMFQRGTVPASSGKLKNPPAELVMEDHMVTGGFDPFGGGTPIYTVSDGTSR
jgi:predicted anti-sigma-YlaC factor YlaD